MKCINMLARANRGSIAGARRASTAAGGWNWLEEDCGDVPDPAKALDMETSQMLRGGHAVQVANANLLNGQLAGATRGGPTAFTRAHVSTLESLHEQEKQAVERIEASVRTEGFRFRPSALLPVVHCSSVVVGGVLSWCGDDVSAAYVSGVKAAIGDYYNDQIRELYEHKPDEVQLKELFKTSRDEELSFVDERSPDGVAQRPSGTVETFAKTSTKVLLEAAKVL